MVSEIPSLATDVGQKHRGQQLGRQGSGSGPWTDPMCGASSYSVCMHVCVCHSELLFSSAGQESAVGVHGGATSGTACFVGPCGWLCLTVCGMCTHAPLCADVCTPLECMLSLPQAERRNPTANGNSSKQAERRNHLGWKVHSIWVAIRELMSGIPLLPLNNHVFYTWRWRTCVDIIKLKIKIESLKQLQK